LYNSKANLRAFYLADSLPTKSCQETRISWDGQQYITKNNSDLNHEIIKSNKNHKKEVAHKNRLKESYISGLWKPMLQHFVKKTHKIATKQLHEEEEI
jgi:hypothetical protein